MRYITIPNDIELVHPVTKKTVYEFGKPIVKSFRDAAFEMWLNDPQAIAPGGRNDSGIVKKRRWMKVCDKIDNIKAGDILELEDQDWNTLCTCVTNPTPGTCNLMPLVELQLMPFVEAILNGEEKK